MTDSCFTIGHSNRDFIDFLALLQLHAVSCCVDVRSSPYSRFVPHYNRETLRTDIELHDIRYMYMGDVLGARYSAPELLMDNGAVDFALVSRLESFQQGIGRVVDGIGRGYRIALMCAEKDPFNCHRFMLLSRALTERQVPVLHIVGDGAPVSQADLEARLLEKYGLQVHQASLFEAPKTRAERLAEAYAARNREVGYRAGG